MTNSPLVVKGLSIKGPVICIGGALIDELYFCDSKPVPGTSNPATFIRTSGGVARNVAQHLSQLDIPVELITQIGEDPDGEILLRDCKKWSIGIGSSLISKAATGKFVAILGPEGELFTAATVSSLESEITPQYLSEIQVVLQSASVLVADCNLSSESLDFLIQFSVSSKIPLIIEPVSVPKAAKLKGLDLSGVYLITPNQNELKAITGISVSDETQLIREVIQTKSIRQIWLRKGELGSEYFSEIVDLNVKPPKIKVSDGTGAGDAALAGWLYGLWNNHSDLKRIQYGHSLAALVLAQKGSHLPHLQTHDLESAFQSFYGTTIS